MGVGADRGSDPEADEGCCSLVKLRLAAEAIEQTLDSGGL